MSIRREEFVLHCRIGSGGGCQRAIGNGKSLAKVHKTNSKNIVAVKGHYTGPGLHGC
jgi:hypothetical protein